MDSVSPSLSRSITPPSAAEPSTRQPITDVNQPEPPSTLDVPVLPPQQQHPTEPSLSRLAVVTQPTAPPPTEDPAPELPFQEMAQDSSPAQDSLPPPVSRSRMVLAYVAVPSSRLNQLRASTNTQLETSNPGSDNSLPRRTQVLEGSYPAFFPQAQSFLLTILGGGDWKVLLSRYAEFEKLAPQVRIFQFLFFVAKANEQ